MNGTGVRRLLALNNSEVYSPVTLNNEWPTLWRMIFMTFFTTVGTIANGFFVSSFFIEQSLNRIGNVYLACVGLADMVITTGVMPTAVVVLISGLWDIQTVCYGLQFLAQGSTYTYSLLFQMVALESFIRLCCTTACYNRFLAIPVGFVSFMMFAISFATSGVGVYLSMDYDYCTRVSYGNYTFRLITALMFQGIPFLCTVTFLVSASLIVRARARRFLMYKRSRQYGRDYKFNLVNIVCYSFYVIAWLPYLVIVNKYPATQDSKFYNSVWLGLSRSIITSFLYSGLNRHFRRAFAHLFYYCCCKSSLTAPFNNRHRSTSAYNYRITNGDVKVHVHYAMPYIPSPPRPGCAGCVGTTLEL